MTAHNGTTPVEILHGDTVPFCSDSILNNSPDSASLSIFDIDDVSLNVSGSHVNNLPISERNAVKTGHRQKSFVDDFYNRIHVEPHSHNFGSIVTLITDEILVWNAYFVPKTCSQIVELNGDEWDLTGLSTPFELNGLGHTTFDIDVPVEGSPTFEGSITFDFTAANDVVVIVSGTRLALFAFVPKYPVRENLESLTDILVAKDGSEQRIALRPVPRQDFKLTVPFSSEKDQARMESVLFGWQKRSWGLPIWTEKILHTANIDADDMAISVDTTNADYRDDSLALVWQSTSSHEVIQIETVAAGSLTLATPMQNSFSGDKLIMPLRVAQMTKSVPGSFAPRDTGERQFTFAVRDNVLLTGHSPAVTYLGIEVVTDPNWIPGGALINSDADITLEDYQTGAFLYYSDSEFNIVVHARRFHNLTRADCWAFRLWWHSLLGRQAVIWLPSFKKDLELTATIGASDTSFNIENISLANNMGLNTLRTHLAFIFPSGTQLYRQITGIVDSGNEEIISIDGSLGLQVDPGDCLICFLDKCRLASDNLDIEWSMNNCNSSDSKFVAVKA